MPPTIFVMEKNKSVASLVAGLIDSQHRRRRRRRRRRHRRQRRCTKVRH